MREALVTILQQRMDKTTTEQFWAVGAFTALSALLLVESSAFKRLFAGGIVAATTLALAVYAIIFVVQRHTAYYRLRKDLADLLDDEDEAPSWMYEQPTGWKWPQWSGVVFYTGWILIAWLALAFVYI